MGLKFFNKDTYESIGEAFNAIRQELLSLTPKDSSGVRWQRGVDGISAVVKARQSATEESGNVPEESTSQLSRYNGYFTIKDVSTYNEDGTVKEYRVAVCDGATWDPKTETSYSCPMIVYTSDNVVYTVILKAQISKVNKSSTIAIRYCHGTRSAEIVTYTHHPLQHTGYFYYTIGDVIIENGVMRIIQRHGITTNEKNFNGTVYMNIGYVKDFCVYYIQPKENDDGTIPSPTEIVICNGNSWDPVKMTSDKSVVSVNNIHVWEIEPKKINIETGTGDVYICYDIDKHLKQLKGEADDSDTSKGDVITVYRGSPTGNCECVAYISTADTGYILQNHTKGMLRLWGVYNGCI